MLGARAEERVAAEQAEYEARMAQREERECMIGRCPGSRPPSLPMPKPCDNDQHNFYRPGVAYYEKLDACRF